MRAILWLAIAMTATAHLACAQTPTPLIVDTDIGDDVDDALALALLLQSPEVEIRLITTVGDDVESRTRLASKELGIYGRQDIPVATGASKPLEDPPYSSRSPQFGILTPEDHLPAAGRNATAAIVETLKESPAPMTILGLGPLTNIALALRRDPGIKNKIGRIVLMGGAYFRQKREYDISRDRMAADIVFRSGVPITAVGLDVTDFFFRLESQFVEQIRDAHNAGSDFLFRLIELWQEGDGAKLPVLYDPVTAAAVLRPSLIQTMSGTVEVEMHDSAFSGVTRFTRADGDAHGPVDVARGVTAVDLIRLFMDRVTAPPRTAK